MISSWLIVHEILHGLIAFPFAYLLYTKTRSLKLVAILYLIAFMVDLDHFVDYFVYYNGWAGLANFFKAQYFKSGSVFAYIPLHAWEWLAILIFINWKRKKWKTVSMAVMMGYIPHLILDTINVGNLLFYSIIYRFNIV